jgi:4-aminobutyrate aminotransferase-like enzyme
MMTPIGEAATNGDDVEALGDRLPELPVVPPGPATRALAERLREVESRNVTFLGPDFPVFWSEARGANVRDADGNVYVDLTGAFGVALAGHAHPAITAAVRGQVGRLAHAMGDVHPGEVKVELLERLAALLPWARTRTVLASSGSEAVEIALKTALLATDRPGIVAFRGGYHGLTVGALASTGREDFRAPFLPRVYPGVRFVPFPRPEREGEGGTRAALEALDEALAAGERDGPPVGAVILEPLQGRGGVRLPPPGFLARVARRVRDADALLILDEIFTGFGRTGTDFAFQAEGVVPDLICLGKALGGGLPLSACSGPAKIMDAWPASRGEALHTSTFLGHPLACASALAFLAVLDEEDLAGRAEEAGERLRRLLEKGLEGVPHVGEVRGRGLLLGIELVDPGAATPEPGPERTGPASRRPPLPPPWPGGGARVAAAALREGLLVLPAGEHGEVVELSPSALITEPQLAWAADTLGRVIRETRPG